MPEERTHSTRVLLFGLHLPAQLSPDLAQSQLVVRLEEPVQANDVEVCAVLE